MTQVWLLYLTVPVCVFPSIFSDRQTLTCFPLYASIYLYICIQNLIMKFSPISVMHCSPPSFIATFYLNCIGWCNSLCLRSMNLYYDVKFLLITVIKQMNAVWRPALSPSIPSLFFPQTMFSDDSSLKLFNHLDAKTYSYHNSPANKGRVIITFQCHLPQIFFVRYSVMWFTPLVLN